MTATPYPYPRETRESSILVGNGTVGPYGPSLFSVFDVADVMVLMKNAGEDRFSDVTLDATVTKSTGAAFDTFSVTFDNPVLATSAFVFQSRRMHERQTAVTKGGALSANELEKELSKQGTTLEELRRDVDRGVAFQPDFDGDPRLPAPEADKVLGWNAAANKLESKTVLQLGTVEVINEPDMASNSHTKVPSQQSVKTYVDTGLGLKAAKAANLSDLADKPAARGNIVVPTYTTLAGLTALDTTKDQLAYVTSNGFEDWYDWTGADLSTRTVIQSVTTTTVVAATNICTKVSHLLSVGSGVVVTTAVNGLALNTVYWVRIIDADTFTLHPTLVDAINNTNIFDLTGSTNFTLKQLRDPAQAVYIIKPGGQLDGSTGAWVRANGSQNFGISGISYKRFADRVLFGLGATSWTGDIVGAGASGAGSWLGDEIAPGSAYAMSYLLVAAQVASVTHPVAGHPKIGLFGAARSLEGVDNNIHMGGAFYASGHSTSGGGVGYAAYAEAVKRPGANTTMQILELEITNLNSTPTTALTSEGGYVQGRTFGILLASGGGNTVAYDADVAFYIGPNGAKFRKGIIFDKLGLAADGGTGYMHALLLPSKAQLDWNTSDGLGNVGFSIHSEVTALASQLRLVAADIGLVVNNVNGGLALRVAPLSTNAAANYPMLSANAPGSSPILWSQGGDANSGMIIRGKGTGGGSLQDGASAAKLAWDTTGVGFFGVAPVARGALAAPTGTITRTTFATSTVTLPQLAERVYAMINDLRAYGLFN